MKMREGPVRRRHDEKREPGDGRAQRESGRGVLSCAEVAERGYPGRAEPVILIGGSGTGKTHLAIALCVEACRKRARFVTAAGLVNELVEAQHHNLLGRALADWSRNTPSGRR